jgi:hypothetical protein
MKFRLHRNTPTPEMLQTCKTLHLLVFLVFIFTYISVKDNSMTKYDIYMNFKLLVMHCILRWQENIGCEN